MRSRRVVSGCWDWPKHATMPAIQFGREATMRFKALFVCADKSRGSARVADLGSSPGADAGCADQPGVFGRGRRDGRCAGQHQEGWLYDHHNRGSDDEGRFSFPGGRLDPGHYTLAIRGIGYDLEARDQPMSLPAPRLGPTSSCGQREMSPRSSPTPNGLEESVARQLSAVGRQIRTADLSASRFSMAGDSVPSDKPRLRARWL